MKYKENMKNKKQNKICFTCFKWHFKQMEEVKNQKNVLYSIYRSSLEIVITNLCKEFKMKKSINDPEGQNKPNEDYFMFNSKC